METIRRLCAVGLKTCAALTLSLPAGASEIRAAIGQVIELGTQTSHELESARRLGRTLVRDRLVVALASSIGAGSTPAFDGIVVDEDSHAVANLSIKRLTRSDAEKLFYVGRRAFETMDRFSKPAAWKRLLKARGRTDLLEHATTLFGPGEPRAHWLVLDLAEAPPPSPSVLNYVAGALTADQPHRRIFVFEAEKTYEIHAGTWSPRACADGL